METDLNKLEELINNVWMNRINSKSRDILVYTGIEGIKMFSAWSKVSLLIEEIVLKTNLTKKELQPLKEQQLIFILSILK